MSEKFKPEKKEVAREVELKIVEPGGEKKFMIGFEGISQKQCRAYNWAIGSAKDAVRICMRRNLAAIGRRVFPPCR